MEENPDGWVAQEATSKHMGEQRSGDQRKVRRLLFLKMKEADAPSSWEEMGV